MQKRNFLILILLSINSAAVAQKIQLATERAPHYAGERVLIRVSVSGFEEEPQPLCKAENISAGLSLKLSNVSPSVTQSMTNINGRITRYKKVVYHFNYYVTAKNAGNYSLGPFVVTQNSKEVRSEEIQLNIQEIKKDPDMGVNLILPNEASYPGQRVPIKIEWWYAGDIASARQLSLSCELFDRFNFIDSPAARGETALPIETENGSLNLRAEVSQQTLDGRQYTVLSAERIMIPNQSGQFEFLPITATMRKVVRWSRDFFGDRRPSAVVPVSAIGKPVRLTVKNLPREDRPDSFAGAVGPGYSMEVSASRTVVRVGDPIELTIEVRGKGNLQNAGLPNLSADDGMSPELFRLPQGEVAGVFDNDKKTFKVTVRVLDESVSNIPALAYSWFDPQSESYQTSRSKPVALRVMPSKVISAKDVVNNSKQTTDSPAFEKINRSGSEEARSIQKNATASFSFSGADLSIESDPALVLQDSRNRFGGFQFQVAMYIASIALLTLAVLDRRRSNMDPEIVRRENNLKKQARRIDRAIKLPLKQAAEEISSALRVMVAEIPDADRSLVQEVLMECENLIYRPGVSTSESTNQNLVSKAASVAQTLLNKTT